MQFTGDSMELIKRFDNGEPYRIVRQLSQSEKLDLENHTDRGSELLADVWDKNWWITCDCQRQHKTIMTVRKTEIGTFHIVTLKKRGDHLPDCPFYSDESSSEKGAQVDGRVDSTFVTFHRDSMGAAKESTDDDTSGKSYASSKPKLYRFLMTLIDDAKLNVFNPAKQPTLAEQFQEIQTVAGRYYLAPNVLLTKFFWTHPAAFNKSCVLLKESKDLFKDPIRPQGLHCWLAEKASGQSIICQGDASFNVRTPIVKSGRHGQSDGPWIVLSTLSHSMESSTWYELQKSVAIMVASKSVLMPVDSRYEQAVALAGMRYCRWMLDAHKRKVIIEKPVFALPGDGTVKPDFIFRSAGKTVFVEVMGAKDQDYLDRKKSLLPKLEALGEVIEFDALEAEHEGRLAEAIQQCMKRVAAKLLS
jgi:hypothetical protein